MKKKKQNNTKRKINDTNSTFKVKNGQNEIFRKVIIFVGLHLTISFVIDYFLN